MASGRRIKSDMKPNRIEELRRAFGWTQQDLAERVGTDKVQISRLERGERRLSPLWQQRLSKALLCDPSELLKLPVQSKAAQELLALPPPPGNLPPGAVPVRMGGRDLPIRGLAMGGDGHYHITSDTVDWTWRPPELIGVSDAFAVFCTGDSMEDVVLEGTILLVHPHQPVRPRDLCVMELQDGALLIKRLLRRTGSHYHLRQYNPAEDFTVETEQVRHCWRVCGQQHP